MTRRGRLDAARRWLPKYAGKNVVRGYAKWYGVDLGCALKELQMLGVPLDPVYVAQLRKTLQNASQRAAVPTDEEPEISDGYGEDWDENFAYIAGFTSGGSPFGMPWDSREGEARG